ncbi:MAG TPA: L-histidine N(alpha)-methyltransferase [Bryobacteraceae bacterium]|nr:L-histidine N(alpha)-methyltransferase [Bryobacteraceae bacterium]
MSAARVATAPALRTFAEDVRAGLSKPQKELLSQYLYDELGSALFEAITLLPEYGLTRADQRLIERLSPDLSPEFSLIAELGSGGGHKTRQILAALGEQNTVRYFPIDVSASALAHCAIELAAFADISPLEYSYLDGIEAATEHRRPGEKLLILFLGSTVGNFDRAPREQFLNDLRALVQPGDALLIGFDLVKPLSRMFAAYDDPTGVTAAFNLNLLGRINRELGGNFVQANFIHQVRYNETEQRIEMHLVSRVGQTVRIPAANFTCSLRSGETIWTESSYKFLPDEIPELAARTGFNHRAQWIDEEWPFLEALWWVQ